MSAFAKLFRSASKNTTRSTRARKAGRKPLTSERLEDRRVMAGLVSSALGSSIVGTARTAYSDTGTASALVNLAAPINQNAVALSDVAVSANFDPVNGRLSVNGSRNSDNIRVTQFNGQIYVDTRAAGNAIASTLRTYSPVAIATLNGKVNSVSVNAVKYVAVNGHDGDDSISVSYSTSDPRLDYHLATQLRVTELTRSPVAAPVGSIATAVHLAGSNSGIVRPALERAIPVEIRGGRGNDTLRATVKSTAAIWGGDGNDVLTGGTGNDQLFGDNGNDVLTAQNGDDQLDGGSGNDALDGGQGRDLLLGGLGADRLLGQAGDDTLLGQEGADQLFGGAGNDDLRGGDGDDTIGGDIGNDQLNGGAGIDHIFAGDGDDVVVTGIGSYDPWNDLGWEVVDLGAGQNAAAVTPRTMHINSATGTNAFVTLPDANAPQASVTKDQQKEMMEKFLKEIKDFFVNNLDRIKNGEMPASEAAGKLYGLAASIVVGVAVPPLAPAAAAIATQYGEFYGDLASDLYDLVNNLDSVSKGRVIGQLAAMSLFLSGIGYGTVAGTLPLAFGKNGWEFVKGVANDLGDAGEGLFDWIGDLF